MTPLVSVLLPVRDGAATVERAIAGISAQTLANWELIVVDDGSTDGTIALADRFARADSRIRVQRQPALGIVAALEAGLALARGKFVARMDADDESHPDRLAEQVALLRERPKLGLVSCLVGFGGDRAASKGYALHVDWINSLLAPEQIAVNRFVESPLAHPSVMFRRELIAQHGGYRAGDFPEDYELWLRWLDAGVPMAKVPRVLLAWHDRPDRLSRTDPRYAPDAFFRLKAKWIANEVKRIEVGREDADERHAHRSRPIFVWGAGRPTRKRAAHLARQGLRIAGYIDVDAKKSTSALGGTGLPVILPREIFAPTDCFVLGYVSARGARELIRGELHARGYSEGRDFLMCA